ncbi:hypothetical protein [Nostoc sp. ATCC 53789]|uniref:hypothetical protein n=1 Tax=Nostoc sp. ATCC 53789 TaxID=76335 RepID=UPI000DED34AA|nr:hypothetical protein [Nostoc sp. ATCC 53789]MBD2512722.1 hypothetical protein [Desmonostoc muscorum FACHB-395]QHG19524.1 hypothetical protein GJB62_28575 [Nostoc sp. ATCC 53789]RCJ17815.1 hypothetical protein A6V25_28960 [Nostoc sp. ATCC 53789]
MSIKEMKSLRRGTPAADNKSLEYLIFEFHSQIQQRQFFSIATLAIFKPAANSGCQVLLQKIL